jgi:beta-lactamase superfamily II metal-dependent hydrolase
MPTFRYAGYPEAKVYDAVDGKQINHLLFGDWIRLEGDAADGWVPVHVRGTSGFMREDDLQTERVLEIVFTDVGQGDGALLVTPKDKHIVIDAGVSDNMYRFLKWRYAGFKKKWTFEAAIMTHPDQDHYLGFTKLFEEENVGFGTVYHNGIMEERTKGRPLGPTKKMGGRRYLTHLVETTAELEAFLADEVRWKHPDNDAWNKQYPAMLHDALQTGRVGAFTMLSTAHDGGFLPGYEASKELTVRVLSPVVEHDANGVAVLRTFGDTPTSKAFDVGKTKNGHSVVLLVEYRDIRLLLGGDLNSPAEVFLMQHYSGLDHAYPWSADEERLITEACLPTFEADVAKACHHGSADYTDAFLRGVNAAATVVSSGDEESHAHPRPDTLGSIGLNGRGIRPLIFSTELMRSTREDEGSIPEEVGRLRQRLDDVADADARAAIQAQLDALVDKLLERNVTVYGSINLRTDGKRAILAYKLERERRYGTALTKWDVYRLEREGQGPFVYAD